MTSHIDEQQREEMAVSDVPPIRPFADFLRDMNRGRSHEELSERLHELVARVRDTGKKGSVVYTVTVEPLKDTFGEVMNVSDEIKVKFPEHNRGSSMFWPNSDGNLQRTDPNQIPFDSLEVLPPVDTETGEILEAKETVR